MSVAPWRVRVVWGNVARRFTYHRLKVFAERFAIQPPAALVAAAAITHFLSNRFTAGMKENDRTGG